MFESTEAGVTFVRMALIHKVGRSAGIADVDFMTPAEVRASLAKDDPLTSRLLEAFLTAFQEWFHLTQMVESRFGTADAYQDQHDRSSEKKNKCRLELQERLKVLGAADRGSSK